jgi:hypothetical protein
LTPNSAIKSENAAFAVIVDPHRDGDIFDAGDRDQRPHDQGQHPEHRRPAVPAGEIEHGLERVERAGADVAEHDPERRKPQCRDAAGRTRIAFLHEVTAAAWGRRLWTEDAPGLVYIGVCVIPVTTPLPRDPPAGIAGDAH